MNIGTRAKLVLLTVIPTLAMFYFAGSVSLEKASIAKEMVKLESLIDISVKVGEVVHELQKERGMSAVFLASKGNKLASELLVQRAEADKKIETLHATLKNFDASKNGNDLKAVLDVAESNLAVLGTKRSSISAFGIAGAESGAYYTKTISSLLDVSSKVSTLSSNSEISRRASAYANLLQAKERAGIERALLTTVFVTDSFTPDTWARFIGNIAAQNVYTDIFFAYAPDNEKEFYKEKVSGKAVDEVARMKKVAMDKESINKDAIDKLKETMFGVDPNYGTKAATEKTNLIKRVEEKLSAIDKSKDTTFGVDPTYWFKTATEKINLIKEVEDKVSSDLLIATVALKNDARNTMLFSIVLALLAVLVAGVIAYYIARNLLRQLGGEPDAATEVAKQIANGNLTTVITLTGGDATSLMASMHAMQQTLKAVIEAQSTMSAENKAGIIDAVIDTEKFHGSYKAMAENINVMAANQTDVMRKVTQCIAEFAHGNFDAPLERFAGQRAFINEGMELLRSDIKTFIADMQHMSQEHDAGDVEVVIDAGKYQGAYAEMVVGVNSMVGAHVTEKRRNDSVDAGTG